MLDAIREAWDLIPELSFGALITYLFEGEDPQEVGDEELRVYVDDFIRNNM